MQRQLFRLTIALIILPVVMIFQNCSNGFDSYGSGSNPSGGSYPVHLADWDDPFPEGYMTSNCLDNPAYNICLSYKNPIFANSGNSFTPALTAITSTPTKERAVFQYGLRVPTTSPLRNKHFKMVDAISPQASSAKGWKYSYQGDTNHYMAQLQSFYWANRQVAYMSERTGKFYYENRMAPILAYDSSAAGNAYFDGIGVSLGYLSTSKGKVDIGLDASVLAHEVGHGNLYVASNSAGISGCTDLGCFCIDKDGCFGAIHEGQGDVHAFLLFPETSTIGEYYSNDAGGLRSASQIKLQGKTAAMLFAQNNGEIHDMGEIYAAIWWEVWYQAKQVGGEKDIEVLFTNHLSGLGSSDNFTTALAVIRTMVGQMNEVDTAAISTAFDTEYIRVGVTLP